MRIINVSIAVLLLTVLAAGGIQAREKQVPRLYAFGFASSFNDSTVYITPIQELDGAWISSGWGFLFGRDSYAYQLRDYLTGQGVEHSTCIISYARKREQVEKKYAKLRKRYAEKLKYIVKELPAEAFRFNVVQPEHPVE